MKIGNIIISVIIRFSQIKSTLPCKKKTQNVKIISTPIKINFSISPEDQTNSHHADTIILNWRDAPCVVATDSFISVSGIRETKSREHLSQSARAV